jgi:hypothetical protein
MPPTVLRTKQKVTTQQLDDGTLEEHREDVFVYVHCYNQACLKYHNLQEGADFEEKVPGIREETSFTYADRGGDMPGIENTHVKFLPQDEKHMFCDECGDQTNVSGEASRKLATQAVGPGMGLKGAERAAALAAAKSNEANIGRDTQIEALEKQVAQLTKLTELALKSNKNTKE